MSKVTTVILAVSTVFASCAARAADLPSGGPPPPPTPAPLMATGYDWTGAHVGFGVGFGWGSDPQTYGISSTTLSQAPPIIPVIDASGSHEISLRGALVEADVGYDWQVQQSFVIGVEEDLSWTGLSGSQANAGNVPNYPPGTPYGLQQNFNFDWEASLRARVGYTPIDRLLVYATGGPALAHLRYNSTFTDFFGENEGVALRAVKLGWTAGVGAEYALTRSWSIQGQYLYSRFGAAKGMGSTFLTDGTTAYVAHSTGISSQNELRIGVNYHFN